MDFSKDASFRSVFVSNIPYEVSDDKLKEILGEVGHIVSFRMIMDTETFKPKGFAFCEFEDSGIANSAIRNLNGREICGRNLRIAPASTKEDLKTAKVGGTGIGVESNIFGPNVPPENAPEEITKAVASLPPEQMFELMKQMKLFILHQPEEARQLLLHNPQLPYALLQAQVVMRIVEPRLAHEYLHKPRNNTPNFSDIAENLPLAELPNPHDIYHSEFPSHQQKSQVGSQFDFCHSSYNNLHSYIAKQDSLQLKPNQHQISKLFSPDIPVKQDIHFQTPSIPFEEIQSHIGPQDPRTIQEITGTTPQERSIYNTMDQPKQSHHIHTNNDLFPGLLRKPTYMDPPLRTMFPDSKNLSENIQTPLSVSGSDFNLYSRLPNSPLNHQNLQFPAARYDAPHDPRRGSHIESTIPSVSGINVGHSPGIHSSQPLNILDSRHDTTIADKATNISSISQEEKTSLILQVLALTDEQIAQLTVEQRQSIILLKEQIAKQTGAAIQARN